MMKHTPVLLDRVIEALGNLNGCMVIDGTFGAGGYTRAFLAAGAKVIAFDRDPSVIQAAAVVGAEYPDTFKFISAPFSKISEFICVTPDALVFDFGVSSMQIDEPARGFSFRFDAPLDMRMDAPVGDNSCSPTAAELIENSSVAQLAEILRNFGDVKKSGIIARAIKQAQPKTTFELRALIHNPKDIAPVFQALRIAVNDELGEIQRVLDTVPTLLQPGGKCICVTFHSLEDRLVKNKFREWTTALGDPRMPTVEQPQFKLLKTHTPSDSELGENSRARSAHLRGVVKYAVFKPCHGHVIA